MRGATIPYTIRKLRDVTAATDTTRMRRKKQLTASPRTFFNSVIDPVTASERLLFSSTSSGTTKMVTMNKKKC
jgi:non-ribosomal peptide synthetase component F